MLTRSTITISVDSFIRAQIFPQSIGAAEPQSRTEVVSRRPTQLVAEPMWNTRRAAPRRFQMVTFGRRWSVKKGAGPQEG
jgi:hypothetical protein